VATISTFSTTSTPGNCDTNFKHWWSKENGENVIISDYHDITEFRTCTSAAFHLVNNCCSIYCTASLWRCLQQRVNNWVHKTYISALTVLIIHKIHIFLDYVQEYMWQHNTLWQSKVGWLIRRLNWLYRGQGIVCGDLVLPG